MIKLSFSQAFNNAFSKLRYMEKSELQALIAAKIEGQGTNVDAGSVLPQILNGIIELVKTPYEILQELTCVSSAGGFTSATGLTKAQAATALGVSESDLDKLFGGSFVRMAYGNNGGMAMIVEYASSELLSMGAPGNVEVVVSRTNDVYAINVTS